MNITVKDALNIVIMRDSTLVAGRGGLENVIRGVSILEVLDEISLLQDGDLLITTAFGLENDAVLLQELVPKLVAAKVAGVIVQLGYYLHEIPPSLIAQCDEYDLPLIHIPKHLAFSEIIKTLLTRIVNHQTVLLEYAQNINSRFTQIVLQNKGFPQIAAVLTDLVDCPVRLLDEDFGLVASSGCAAGASFLNPENLQDEYNLLIKANLLPLPNQALNPASLVIPSFHSPLVPQQILFPFVANNHVHGYISLLWPDDSRRFSDMDFSAVSAASTVCSLLMLKRIAVAETENRIQGDFLNDVISGNYKSAETLYRRAKYFGYDSDKNYLIMIINVDNFSNLSDYKTEQELQLVKNKLMATVRLCLYSYTKQALIALQSDDILVLLQANPEDYIGKTRTLASIIQQQILEETASTVSISIGQCYRELTDLHKSFLEAEKALAIGKKVNGPSCITAYEQLGIYRLFLTSGDTAEMEKFYNDVIRKLVDYDRIHGTQLLKTLEVFVKENGEFKATAEKLFIHRHSLKYRLKRIQEITNFDPLNWEDHLQLQLGIVFFHLLSK